MDGKSYQKTISKAYPISIITRVAEFIMLALIGAIGVLIHAYLRIPLKLPGHHGVIYMAILISGKLLSKKSYACSLSGIGAAAMLLMPLGFKDPFIPVIYLFPGFIVDLLYYWFKNESAKMIYTAIFCGTAYMIIPEIRLVISLFTGIIYGSFITGFLYPFLTHFIFGFAGGIIGSGAIQLIRKRKK